MSQTTQELSIGTSQLQELTPREVLNAVRAVRRAYYTELHRYASGKATIRMDSLPENVRTSRENLKQLSSAALEWFKRAAGGDFYVDGSYSRVVQIDLDKHGMQEHTFDAPSWGDAAIARAPFRGIVSLAGAQEGCLEEGCNLVIDTYPHRGDVFSGRRLIMPLFSMVDIGTPAEAPSYL